MALSGGGDWSPLSRAVDAARIRAGRFEPGDWSDLACRARQEAVDIEAWERRRHSRTVRLWIAHLEVQAAALDAADAHFRLAGNLRQVHHRTGRQPELSAVDEPARCLVATGERRRLDADYPRHALACRADREPYGPFERAHVAGYVAALIAGRARLLARHGAPALAPPGPAPPLAYWRVRHRVLFLAGPGEAPLRAAELAATIVDGAGQALALIAGLEADDGRPSPADGHWIHPAADLGPFRAVALWDDYDAAEHDPGEPAALAAVLGRAVREVGATFAQERTSARRDAAPRKI
ncbi:hypothetical protein ABZ863_26515 [Saccharomonospora sp. NPDC046836]|uniref:hypothetical protein n=1 Tax=Saccharomonospora sp. NPDC046836 TaxID=3156921 RepID=UPI0033EC2CC3